MRCANFSLKGECAMPLEPAQNPLISAIIPTFNAARFLPEAIASIRQQGYDPLEIIVVDDGSTDETNSIIANWPDVRYLHQPNQGPSAARNAGIQAARSELLAFLDVDDLWTPDHLRLLLPHLLAEPELRFVWGAVNFVRLGEFIAGSRSHGLLRENVPVFLVGSGIYRRKVFDEVGLFDPALRMGEDTDWLARTRLLQTAQRQIPDTVLIYREREGSLTSGKKSFQGLNTMAVLQRSILRHRANRQKQDASNCGGQPR
jgi:glycosyltransferase involved in cell wall biosynthesis